jgi:hypothetical protein
VLHQKYICICVHLRLELRLNERVSHCCSQLALTLGRRCLFSLKTFITALLNLAGDLQFLLYFYVFQILSNRHVFRKKKTRFQSRQASEEQLSSGTCAFFVLGTRWVSQSRHPRHWARSLLARREAGGSPVSFSLIPGALTLTAFSHSFLKRTVFLSLAATGSTQSWFCVGSELCDHHHFIVEHFHHPRRNSVLASSQSPSAWPHSRSH